MDLQNKRKSIQQVEFSVKSFDEETRIFSGYANVKNHRDFACDVTTDGAFKASIDHHTEKETVPDMYYNHDVGELPIGKWLSIVEDEVGLLVQGQLAKGVQKADEIYQLMKMGALSGLSIGYFVLDEEYDKSTKTNYLKSVHVTEISVVNRPCNDLSHITTVKSLIEQGEIPSPKHIEQVLRDAGFSRKQATAFVSHGYKSLDQSDSDSEDKYIHEISKSLTELNNLFK